MESAGFSRRCMGMSVSLRVVTSSTGLPSKRCPGVRFLSRVDREFGIFQHVAPTMRLLFEFPHETGLIRRFTGNVGNPCRKSMGIDPPVVIRRGDAIAFSERPHETDPSTQLQVEKFKDHSWFLRFLQDITL